eukprot:4859589-Pyramimonas_sp.AAC.1
MQCDVIVGASPVVQEAARRAAGGEITSVRGEIDSAGGEIASSAGDGGVVLLHTGGTMGLFGLAQRYPGQFI